VVEEEIRVAEHLLVVDHSEAVEDPLEEMEVHLEELVVHSAHATVPLVGEEGPSLVGL
jgi:hypothetical protein